MKLTNTTVLAVLLSLSVTASIASADMMTYNGPSLTEHVRFHGQGMLADGKRVPAGLYGVTYQDQQLQAFCVDAEHYAGNCQVTEEGVDFLHNGSLVAYLYETYINSATTSELAAGLGVALWEVLYEDEANGFDASSGYFHITSNPGVTAAANTMLLDMPDDYQSVLDLTVLHSDCKQDMLVSGLGVVPEPATLGLLLLGAPLLVKVSRRRRFLA